MEFRKKIIFTLLTIGLSFLSYAQTGIGTVTPNESSQLDISATDRGLLLPRVMLIKTTDKNPITNPETSLIVYNTSLMNDVTPGYYYWDGIKWARIARTDEIVLSPEQIASLKGEQGTPGKDGVPGLSGAQGPAGQTGGQGPQGLPGIGGKTSAGANITIAGAGTEDSPYVVNAVIPTTVGTADNGLTVSNGTNVQLGGTLSKPTEITTAGANTLAIKGLQTGTSSDKLVVADANGILKTITAATPAGDNLGNHTADKDLAMSAFNINNVKNLDVKGTSTLADKVFIKKTGIAPSDGASQVMVDNTTGELYKVGSASSTSAKPISYATYTLSNVDKDYVSNFNTKINSNLYTVVIVGSSFNKRIGLYLNAVPPVNVITVVSNSEWYIQADYLDASTGDDLNGTWTINLMIINNSMVNILSPQNFNLNGSNVGNAAGPPAGI